MLTSMDFEIIKLAQVDGNVFTRYYFSGFEFQNWQKLFHHAGQSSITIIGGVGSGKTVGAGVSAATWCAMLDYFNFMDVAPTAWQSSLMYDAILRFAEAGKYGEKFIKSYASKPYPIIRLINGSEMRFMTAQDDISRLRGWEGDWMHLDEGGFIDTLSNTMSIMRSRLRGKTPTGRPRLGRLSLTTTATDNPDLWDRFDRMYDDPVEYLSFTVRTDQNPHLSERDIRLMADEMPEELRATEMDGQRPTGRGVYFPVHVVQACEDQSLNDMAKEAVKRGVPGAVYEESPRLGVYRYAIPPSLGRDYLIVGDPGQGNPPKRNAAVIGVFDITGFPNEPATMVAFAWVYGGGRYEPFVQQYKAWYSSYKCMLSAAVESTSTQKTFEEYAFTLGYDGEQMYIEGIDLSGNKKNTGLQACIQLFQRGLWKLPTIRGMRNQLVNYTLPDTKLAQDIVSMLTVAASWLRAWRIWGNDDNDEEEEESSEDNRDQHFNKPAPYRGVRARQLTKRPR